MAATSVELVQSEWRDGIRRCEEYAIDASGDRVWSQIAQGVLPDVAGASSRSALPREPISEVLVRILNAYQSSSGITGCGLRSVRFSAGESEIPVKAATIEASSTRRGWTPDNLLRPDSGVAAAALSLDELRSIRARLAGFSRRLDIGSRLLEAIEQSDPCGFSAIQSH